MCSHAHAVAGNACPNDATYIHGRGGDVPVALPLLSGTKKMDIDVTVHNPLQSCVVNNTPYTDAFECAPRNIPSRKAGNIPTSRNIPSNVVNNPTRNMSTDAPTKIPFGNCSEIPSKSSGITRIIPTHTSIPCAMLNAQNSQATEPRIDMPQIRQQSLNIRDRKSNKSVGSSRSDEDVG
jgi:hypothetical protein